MVWMYRCMAMVVPRSSDERAEGEMTMFEKGVKLVFWAVAWLLSYFLWAGLGYETLYWIVTVLLFIGLPLFLFSRKIRK